MKIVFGIILILISLVSLVSMIGEGSRGAELGGALSGFIIFAALGGYLIYSGANKSKKE